MIDFNDRTIHDYEDLDLSGVVDLNKTAIACRSEEEARHLLAFMKRHYHYKCVSWDFPKTYFERYGGDVCCYRLSPRMTYCSIQYYIDHGFDIVEFSSLLPDLTDTEISEEDLLDFLFGR